MYEKGKIVKITFEYENTTESIEGIRAQKYLDNINTMSVILDLQCINPLNDENDWNIEN